MTFIRPVLHARDSSGRQVSLLNDEPGHDGGWVSINSNDFTPPGTPMLWRSDSYDSRTSNEAQLPLTPPNLAGEQTTRARDNDAVETKRYPCRFKLIHGCDKSFTTSGHASRHSKIHTAEKAVCCTFNDCKKKFTRADNMKQHLEVHRKDCARTALRNNPPPKLTLAAGVKKLSRPSSRTDWPEQLTIDRSLVPLPPDTYSVVSIYAIPSPTASPRPSCGALDMGGFQHSLPTPTSRPNSAHGLDALAAAVASQIRH